MDIKLRNIFISLLAGLTVSSCGLMDMDETELAAMGMQLDHRDTVYVMVGDTLELHPLFTPDSVSVKQVLWLSSNERVLKPADNAYAALEEGWATVRAMSVAWLVEDSCTVCVMPRWEQVNWKFPYEMVIYARVTVHGQPFDPETMRVAAFVGDSMRGEGVYMKYGDLEYVRFRIGSEVEYTDNPEAYGETVNFRVYYRKEMRYEEFPLSIEFDAETHGTLSQLVELKTDD